MWSDYVNEEFLGDFCVIKKRKNGVNFGEILEKFLCDFCVILGKILCDFLKYSAAYD